MANDEWTVRRMMIEDVRTVLSEAPAVRAAQIMVQSRIRHLVVTETGGEVVGVVSERQILKHFSPWLSEVAPSAEVQTPFPRCQVRDIMAQPPITIRANTSIRAAAGIFAAKKIGCLPVVQGRNHLVGLVTAVDVLKFVGRHHLPEAEEQFAVFRPPAFLSKDMKLTVPAGYFPEQDPQKEVSVILAYARSSKRIGVKLLTRGAQEGEDLLGARPATFSDKYLAIPAEDFLKHHNLNIRGSLEVVQNKDTGYLVLSPILKP